MNNREFNTLVLLSVALLMVCGCGGNSGPLPQDQIVMEKNIADRLMKPETGAATGPRVEPFPELSSPTTLEPGVVTYNVKIPIKTGGTQRIWIYRPDPKPAGKLPCILIAPAGTTLFHGKGLAEDDRKEHIPYVKAGYAVIAYELSGPANNNSSNEDLKEAIAAFRKANFGLSNASAAIEYAKQKVPFVDVDKLYTAGHSSAGGVAIYVAQKDRRINGVMAFAPAVDYVAVLQPSGMQYMKGLVENFENYIEQISPANFVAELNCPTFIFYAEDDDVILEPSLKTFAVDLINNGTPVTAKREKTGGHYDSMINKGIPEAIQWLKKLEP